MSRHREGLGRRIVAVLEAGGALGAYQAGALEGLAEAGMAPDWIAGLSIGAINGAIFAASPPEQAVERLRDFWTSVTTRAPPLMPQMRRWNGVASLLRGQRGFFRPRPPAAWMGSDPCASLYETSELAATLGRLVDVDRLNASHIRFTLGATDAEAGELAIFDTRNEPIGLAHLLATGALPPNFPAVEIDGRLHWDGALAGLSLLEHVVDTEPDGDLLVFQIDLFAAAGRLPQSLDEISERKEDVTFAARTRGARRAVLRLESLRGRRALDIVPLVYRPEGPQGRTKDFDFDRDAMEERWAQGLADARQALKSAPWRRPGAAQAARLFDLSPRSSAAD